MGTTVSAFEQPILAAAPPAAPAGVCTGKGMDYSPLSQPCQNDFAKTGLYSKDNTVSRMEVNRGFKSRPLNCLHPHKESVIFPDLSLCAI
jgi:hypothetical protein